MLRNRKSSPRLARPRLAAAVLSLAALAGAVLATRLPGCSGTRETGDEKPESTALSAFGDLALVFDDITESTGVDFTYRNGFEAKHCAILESLGGGVGVFDYDRDGNLDLFFPGGGHYGENNGADTKILGYPGVLYHSRGGMQYADVSQAATVTSAPFYTHGCASCDYDHDGFTDFLVTGYGGVQLFHNQGDGTFAETSRAVGLTDKLWSSSAAWGDLNGDGNPDLYIAHYATWKMGDPHCTAPAGYEKDCEICPPKMFQALPDVVYFSTGEGGFADKTEFAKILVGKRADDKDNTFGKGLGVVLGDVDLDGDLDIYVANDTVANFLYINNGAGEFRDVAGLNGGAYNEQATPDGSMGVDLGDYNNDGKPDIFVANFERESFAMYHNLDAKKDNPHFSHVSKRLGITALGQLYVGFGTTFIDVERDGDLDILVANGHVINYPSGGIGMLKQLPLALLNRPLGDGRSRRFVSYTDFPKGSYFASRHRGRGLATGDLDNDGDQDLIFCHTNDPSSVIRNGAVTANGELKVRLIGTRSNRDAIGAILTLHTESKAGALDQQRQIKGGGSYLSQSDLACHWGVPEGSTVKGLSIRWPSGREQRISDEQLPLGRELTFIESVQ